MRAAFRRGGFYAWHVPLPPFFNALVNGNAKLFCLDQDKDIEAQSEDVLVASQFIKTQFSDEAKDLTKCFTRMFHKHIFL